MSERNLRKTRVGLVTSDKMDKTVVVSVKDKVRHPLYKKIVNRTYKLKAHDENNECGIGDRVLVMETRPVSKDKRYSLAFECGVMSLGETPKVLTHEGVDLERDLSSVASQIKSYVNLVKHSKIYPVLDFRVTRKLF